MPERAVVNASSLIFLAKSGMIHFLQQAVPQILIPAAVTEAISRRGPDDITARTLASASWLITVDAPGIPPPIQAWELGPGESAVLAYAQAHPGVVAIIDDGAGRCCAELVGVPLLGTLGLVMIANKRGLIPAACPVVALLKQHVN